jgi:hypothetical protein
MSVIWCGSSLWQAGGGCHPRRAGWKGREEPRVRDSAASRRAQPFPEESIRQPERTAPEKPALSGPRYALPRRRRSVQPGSKTDNREIPGNRLFGLAEGASPVHQPCRGCPGKLLRRQARKIASPISSWPGSTRPSTPWGVRNKDVDPRVKPAQDDLRSFPARLTQVKLARELSPDNPASLAKHGTP